MRPFAKLARILFCNGTCDLKVPNFYQTYILSFMTGNSNDSIVDVTTSVPAKVVNNNFDNKLEIVP